MVKMALTRAQELRRDPTEAEKALWARLCRRQMGGNLFRRQSPIGRYIIDFVCYRQKLIIEVDGGQHAIESKRDAVRTQWLEGEGFRVLRFWNNKVLNNIDGVIETIGTAMQLNSSPLDGGRSGGGLSLVSNARRRRDGAGDSRPSPPSLRIGG